MTLKTLQSALTEERQKGQVLDSHIVDSQNVTGELLVRQIARVKGPSFVAVLIHSYEMKVCEQRSFEPSRLGSFDWRRLTGVAAEIFHHFRVHRAYRVRRNARLAEPLSTDSYAAFATVRFARRLRVVG